MSQRGYLWLLVPALPQAGMSVAVGLSGEPGWRAEPAWKVAGQEEKQLSS